MNSINDVINNVYNSMINIILKDMQEENFDEIKSEYKRILLNRYGELSINNMSFDDLYSKIYKIEYKEWNDMSAQMKNHVLLKDQNLDEIISIANGGYSYAKERLYNGKLISEELANDGVKRMDELYDGVKDYNKGLADWHISEGSMDLKYASGQTDYMSLRIGRMK